MFKDSWVIYAMLSAFFAALTSILAKIGISDINSNLATAIRTIVVLIMAWGIVFMTGAQSGIQDITAKSWIFLVLSGIATGPVSYTHLRAHETSQDSGSRLRH